MKPSVAVPILTLVAAVVAAPAAEPELVTDRPDQTESASIVPAGRVQLETGWTFAEEDSGGLDAETLSGPGSLVRIGLASRLELRVGWEGRIDTDVRGPGFSEDDDGAGDADLGFKLSLRRADAGTAIAVIAGSTLPVGDEPFSSERSDPFARLVVARDLSERLSLGANLGAVWGTETDATGDRDTLGAGLYTLALGIALAERVGLFVEAFGEVPLNAGGGPANSLDAGLTWLVRDNVQLDLACGAGISEAAEDRFVGLGVSVRFPR